MCAVQVNDYSVKTK